MKKTKLTTPEWRLFLLSDCIKKYSKVMDGTTTLRSGGKVSILGITDKLNSDFLDGLITDEQVPVILSELRTEWEFTGKVVDNGRENYTTCEYCQKQDIRYRYLCVNKVTRVWLSLGSVCVGCVIHGEDRMRDKKFAKNFIGDLDKMKSSATNIDPGKLETENGEAILKTRKEQYIRILPSLKELRARGYDKDEFFKSLQTQWKDGKVLTDKQEVKLKEFAEKAKLYNSNYAEVGGAGTVLRTLDSRLQYQKVLALIDKYPSNTFFIHCKQMLEQSGSLTSKMVDALINRKPNNNK